MYSQLQVLYWLIARNMKVLKKELPSLIFDSIFSLLLHLFLFIKIFPLFGISFEFIPSIFLGTAVLWVLFMQGDSYCLDISNDLQGARVIDYHLTLPISKQLLLLSYAITYMLQTTIIALPSIVIGVYVLSLYAPNVLLTWTPFLMYFFVVEAFCALFFLSLAFRYSFLWLLTNLWARRLGPMFCFGAASAPWYYMVKKLPLMSCIALCNPATYIAEGLRSTMLTGAFLPVSICCVALVVIAGISYVMLLSGIKAKLDAI